MNNIDALNEKGLKELIRVHREEILDLTCENNELKKHKESIK